MKISKLKRHIETLEATCELFLNQEEDNDEEKKENITLQIRAFEEIVRECKEEVNSADEKHKKHVLKLLYGIDLENFSESLEECMQGQAYYQPVNEEEKKINNLKSIILSVDDVVEKLALEYKSLLHVNRRWYRFKGFRLKKLSKFLVRLMDLKEKLEVQLEKDSQKTAKLILDNFYSLYIFLSFLASLSIIKKKEMLLIEIASHIDKYIEVIEPSFKHRLLHHDDLVYHYTVYELKELKNSIFKGLAPR